MRILILGLLLSSTALAKTDCEYMGKETDKRYENTKLGCHINEAKYCDKENSIFSWSLKIGHDFDNEKNNKAPCLKIQKRMKTLEKQGMKDCDEWGALDEAEMEICGN